ncbi:unnamed protein product, partial [Rotaria sp. Silwood1]
MPACKVIENHFQLVFKCIMKLGIKLDNISINHNLKYSTSNDFDRLPNNDIIKKIENEFYSILEILRIATDPIQVEEVDDVPSMETDEKQCFAASSDTCNTQHRKRIRTSPSLLSQTKSSSELEFLTTTASTQNVNNELPQYGAPKVLTEPNRYQRVRMLSDLEDGRCPIIQAGGEDAAQRTHVEIQVPKDDNTELFVRVRAVTVNNDKHHFKAVIRKNPSIDASSIHHDGERRCLKFNKNDFDREADCTYLPISLKERKNGKKEILAYLITKKRQGSQDQKLFKNGIFHLCKLEFGLCVECGHDEYKLVSTVSYSSIIEDSDGPLSINSDSVQLQKLCIRGGQIINLPLSVDCPKK